MEVPEERFLPERRKGRVNIYEMCNSEWFEFRMMYFVRVLSSGRIVADLGRIVADLGQYITLKGSLNPKLELFVKMPWRESGENCCFCKH